MAANGDLMVIWVILDGNDKVARDTTESCGMGVLLNFAFGTGIRMGWENKTL